MKVGDKKEDNGRGDFSIPYKVGCELKSSYGSSCGVFYTWISAQKITWTYLLKVKK